MQSFSRDEFMQKCRLLAIILWNVSVPVYELQPDAAVCLDMCVCVCVGSRSVSVSSGCGAQHSCSLCSRLSKQNYTTTHSLHVCVCVLNWEDCGMSLFKCLPSELLSELQAGLKSREFNSHKHQTTIWRNCSLLPENNTEVYCETCWWKITQFYHTWRQTSHSAAGNVPIKDDDEGTLLL